MLDSVDDDTSEELELEGTSEETEKAADGRLEAATEGLEDSSEGFEKASSGFEAGADGFDEDAKEILGDSAGAFEDVSEGCKGASGECEDASKGFKESAEDSTVGFEETSEGLIVAAVSLCSVTVAVSSLFGVSLTSLALVDLETLGECEHDLSLHIISFTRNWVSVLPSGV